jgi:signal recognition particle subunit SRP54
MRKMMKSMNKMQGKGIPPNMKSMMKR